jgi:hexokinase
MPSLASAMTTLRKALLAALRSIFRGRSFLQALFAFWISPAALRGSDSLDYKTALSSRTIDEFLKEAEQRFLGPIEGDRLRCFSDDLKLQFRDRLQSHPECMLPSFNHLLPSGSEKGRYLALDVGGSTLRVALVALRGREATGNEGEIVRMSSFKITPDIKKLEGMAFFDWMALRIKEVLKDDVPQDSTEAVPMGLAWSFPVECVLSDWSEYTMCTNRIANLGRHL